jgi:L-aminopeptidase/D-esterase-like protein
VPGLRIGHHTDLRRPTGCTVVLCEQGAVGGVDVRGAAPGTRETDLLRDGKLVEQVHAVLLSGGSAFGLDAASGVMRWLEEHGHGFTVALPVATQLQHTALRIPIVPAAVLFDLWLGDPSIRPDADAGHAACIAASTRSGPLAQGNVGAGAGATVGKLFGIERAMKGGIGSASLQAGGITVAALVAVNAIGDVVDPQSGSVIAGARTPDGLHLLDSMAAIRNGAWPEPMRAGSATTIGVVGTDAVLSKAQANQMASMAHDGLARTINPAHTMTDGDTLFALATGRSGVAAHLTVLGALAAEVTARAVLNAVRHAVGLSGPGLPTLPAARDLRA